MSPRPTRWSLLIHGRVTSSNDSIRRSNCPERVLTNLRRQVRRLMVGHHLGCCGPPPARHIWLRLHSAFRARSDNLRRAPTLRGDSVAESALVDNGRRLPVLSAPRTPSTSCSAGLGSSSSFCSSGSRSCVISSSLALSLACCLPWNPTHMSRSTNKQAIATFTIFKRRRFARCSTLLRPGIVVAMDGASFILTAQRSETFKCARPRPN